MRIKLFLILFYQDFFILRSTNRILFGILLIMNVANHDGN